MEHKPHWEDGLRQSQGDDAVLGAAFRDVAVPDGLAQRLIDRLAAARSETDIPAQVSEAAVAVVEEPIAAPVRKAAAGSRRWLLLAAAISSAAAILLAVAWLKTPRTTTYTMAAVLEEATDFFHLETPSPDRQSTAAAPPSDYPFSRDVLRPRQVRWRPIQGFLGRDGIAYDLSGPGNTRATLYVIPRVVAGLPTQPPTVPRPTTAGCSTAAWQVSGLLYVLVVDGGPAAYRGYLNLPSGPLT
jgi:hypothetical protein